jgi:tetratricopeptide (TPR) repeat protein
MMRPATIVFLLLFAVLRAFPCGADTNTRSFLSALESYKNGDYPAAVAGFSAIAETGVRNGKLFYNLGNAYLKNNDLGRAILWYERALKLIPGDPDLKFNLVYARSLAKDAPEEMVSPLVRIFFFWKFQLSHRTVVLLAIGFNLFFWIALMAWRLTHRRGLRRLALVLVFPALIFMLTACHNYYETAYRQSAVVLPAEVSVRSGLQETSTELFKLHAGARVRMVRTLDDHYQIRFSKEKIGWVSRQDVGLY